MVRATSGQPTQQPPNLARSTGIALVSVEQCPEAEDAMGAWVLVAALGLLYAAMASIVGRRSLAWNRRQGRTGSRAVVIAMAAALVWPVTISFWEADWLVTGRRTWRGDR